MWNNVPSVAEQLLDSSYSAFNLDIGSSMFVNVPTNLYASSLGCTTNLWASNAMAAVAAMGVDASQFQFRCVVTAMPLSARFACGVAVCLCVPWVNPTTRLRCLDLPARCVLSDVLSCNCGDGVRRRGRPPVW